MEPDLTGHEQERDAPSGEMTGEPRVDAAVRRLADLDELPVTEHPPVFERVHGQLVEVLGELHGAGSADPADGSDPAGAGG